MFYLFFVRIDNKIFLHKISPGGQGLSRGEKLDFVGTKGHLQTGYFT
jgi:hypothetical protein